MKSKLLIGADGPHSHIRRLFNFPKPRETLKGIGAELTNTTLDPRYVHIYVGQTLAPGFFAWVIPTNTSGTTARIGLCIGKNSPHHLQHYYSLLLQQPLLKDTTIIRQFGGTIPLGPLKNTVEDHLMLVGDAAAQVKPTSGGGLYPGLLCATHCSTVAEDALSTQRFDAAFLKRYHIKWTKDIGRELSLGMKFRTIFTRLTDRELNKYLEKLNKEKIIQIINTSGDIDYPSRLALPLIKAMPSLLSFAPTLLKRTK
jgi:flavin-dependent dehydrogenase